MIERKSWNEFQAAGLLFLINALLHAFGWAIVLEKDVEAGKITDAYPARVKFRGFTEEDQDESYAAIDKHLKEYNSQQKQQL